MDNVDSGKLCTVGLAEWTFNGCGSAARIGEASMDRIEGTFAVTAMTSFLVLIGLMTYVMA